MGTIQNVIFIAISSSFSFILMTIFSDRSDFNVFRKRVWDKKHSQKNRHQEVINLKSLSTFSCYIINKLPKKKLHKQNEWIHGWKVTQKTSIDMQYIYRRWKGQWIYYDNNQPALCARALLMYIWEKCPPTHLIEIYKSI